MSIINLQESFKKAKERIASTNEPLHGPSRRADAGSFRMEDKVQQKLFSLLSGQEKPPFAWILSELKSFCSNSNLRCPTRATIYTFMARGPAHLYPVSGLPEAVRACLYNLDDTVEVPGHQLAFYAFHYGSTRAVSFAAGLPWLDLYQAHRLPGWRPKTRALMEAVLHVRKI